MLPARLQESARGRSLLVLVGDPAGNIGFLVEDVGEHRITLVRGVGEPVAVDLDPLEAAIRKSAVCGGIGPTRSRLRLNGRQRVADGPVQVVDRLVALLPDIGVEQVVDLPAGSARLADQGAAGQGLATAAGIGSCLRAL